MKVKFKASGRETVVSCSRKAAICPARTIWDPFLLSMHLNKLCTAIIVKMGVSYALPVYGILWMYITHGVVVCALTELLLQLVKGRINQRSKSAWGTLCSCHSSSPALLRESQSKGSHATPMIAPPILY